MQIRRFFAKDMRNALADVSRELGPDAAILSSRRIGDGVELLAAIDYDPSVLVGVTPRSAEPVPVEVVNSENFAQESLPKPRVASRPAANKKPSFEAANDLFLQAAAADRDSAKASKAVQNKLDLARRALPDFKVMPPHALSGIKAAKDKEAAGRGSATRDDEPIAVSVALQAQAKMQHGLNDSERQSLFADWQQEGPNRGLTDLKEEVRQLRGLMQEQLQGLAWRDVKQRQPLRAMLTKRLAQLELAAKLRDHYAAAEGRDAEQALAAALASIAHDVISSDDPMLDRGGIYAFVGATGVGKTTTIAKLAARFALRHGAGSVALISTDSYRIAGHDQLGTYAHLIGCAIRTATNSAELQDALDGFMDRRLILIDTAGMSQRDARLAEQLSALASSRYPIKQLLVLSATAQRAILQESVKQFGQFRVHGAILTKLDETTSLGAVLSVLLESRLPLLASCDGQRVPEDLRSLRGPQLVDRALKLAEQFREGPDEWCLAQELKATAHAGI